MRRIPPVLLAAMAASAVLAPAAPAAVRSCSAKIDFNLKVSSARNMTCAAARADLRGHRGSISYRFTTPGGFACKRVMGNRLSGQWRCVKGMRAYRFEFGD
jgi:hypothetical protein